MNFKIKDMIKSSIEIWKTANKPKWEDTKTTFYNIMIISFFIGFIIFSLFVLVHSLILFSYLFSYDVLTIIAIFSIITTVLLILIFYSK